MVDKNAKLNETTEKSVLWSTQSFLKFDIYDRELGGPDDGVTLTSIKFNNS